MLHMPLSEIISKITKAKSLPEEEIKKLIQQKVDGFDGLVSEEGAAHIVAHDLQVELFKAVETGDMKIKDIVLGRRNPKVIGQITQTFEPRTFDKRGKTGQVGSFVLSDDTSEIRIVIWDQRVSWLQDGKLQVGKNIRVKGGYVKQGRYGKEIHLNLRSQIILDIADKIEVIARSTDSPSQTSAPIETTLIEVQSGQDVKVTGTIVRVFVPRFYEVCPECSKSIKESECNEHGKVEAKPAAVVSFVLDDGTASMRCTAFQDQAAAIIDMSAKEAKELSSNEVLLQEKVDETLLGKEAEIEGRVKHNAGFDRTEIMLNKTNLNLDPILIAKKLMR